MGPKFHLCYIWPTGHPHDLADNAIGAWRPPIEIHSTHDLDHDMSRSPWNIGRKSNLCHAGHPNDLVDQCSVWSAWYPPKLPIFSWPWRWPVKVTLKIGSKFHLLCHPNDLADQCYGSVIEGYSTHDLEPVCHPEKIGSKFHLCYIWPIGHPMT